MEQEKWLAKGLGAPNPQWCVRATTMYQHLSAVFAPDVPYRKKFHMFQVGGFGRRVYCEGDELDCLLVGDARESLFEELVWQRIAEALESPERLFDIVPYEISDKGLVVLVGNEVVFKIQYVRAAFDDTRRLQPLSTSSTEQVRTLREDLEDVDKYRKMIEGDPSLFVCYHFFRRWAERVGLYGTIGHLSSSNLQKLVPYIAARTLDPKLSQELNNPLLQHEAIGPSQTQTNVLLTKVEDLCNTLAITAPSPASDTFYEEILEEIAGRPLTSRFSCENYIEVSMIYSGNSTVQGTKIMEHIQGWIPQLVRDLEFNFPMTEFRLWPNRLVREGIDDKGKDYSHWEGCWLISAPVSQPMTEAFVKLLQRWVKKLERDAECSYSGPAMTVFADLVPRSKVADQALVNDRQNWSRPSLEISPELFQNEKGSKSNSSLAPISAQKPPPLSQSNAATSRKLRPALDILHRLMYDNEFDLDDYMVGYADRHANVNYEKPARNWVTDVTHEEFIPQSRIQFFKRVSDGVWVWDRQRKVDFVFGSRD